MLVFIVCKTCGNDITSLYPVISLIRQKRLSAVLKSRNIESAEDEYKYIVTVTGSLRDVLKDLGITLQCCVTTISTGLNYREVPIKNGLRF